MWNRSWCWILLNVHEGPQGIRPFCNTIALEPGMILTNEPGVYKENKHGIRTENTLLVTKHLRMMKWENSISLILFHIAQLT